MTLVAVRRLHVWCLRIRREGRSRGLWRTIAGIAALLGVSILVILYLRVVKARVVPKLQKVLWTICQNVFKIASSRRQVCGDKSKSGKRFRLLKARRF